MPEIFGNQQGEYFAIQKQSWVIMIYNKYIWLNMLQMMREKVCYQTTSVLSSREKILYPGPHKSTTECYANHSYDDTEE